jgi:hypothetical protein
MDETRKANLSNKMKSRWNEAREYASILYIPEIEIYNYYLDICRKYKDYLLDPNKRDLFIEACMSEIESKKRYQALRNKALGIKEIEELGDENIEGPEREFEKREETRNTNINEKKGPMNDLKLMLWVIEKIGSIEKTERVFKAAKKAMEVMDS